MGKGGSGKKQKKQKKSHQANDEYNLDLELYTGRHFLQDEAIIVHLDVWQPDGYADELCWLEIYHGKFIDVLPDKLGKRPLYMGAHDLY